MALVFDSPINSLGGLIFESPVYVAGGNFNGIAVARKHQRNYLQTGAYQDPSGITANDTWVEPVSIELIQNVSVGTLDLQINGLFTYTPPPTFIGYVTFQYRLWELGVPSNIGTVTIAVDGDYAGQSVTGSLLQKLTAATLSSAFAGTSIASLPIRLLSASTYTGTQSLPFIVGAVTPRKTWPLHHSTIDYNAFWLARSVQPSKRLNAAGPFKPGLGFAGYAQQASVLKYVFPSDVAMGWDAQAMPLQAQAQTVATTAPFLFPYPQIVNATFELTSWSATFSFT